MINLEIRLAMGGKEVSFDPFVEIIVQKVRASIREEMSRVRPVQEQRESDFSRGANSEMPRQAVSIREAARLLSISPRTVDKYVALKVIRTVRFGRRVLVPMKSVNEVAAKGIPWRRSLVSTGKQQGQSPPPHSD
jgi:excisionase family DNA binding protein